MRTYLVNQLIRFAKFLTTSDEVSRQLDHAEGRMTMDEILLTHEWGN